jgi:hypothetical protein
VDVLCINTPACRPGVTPIPIPSPLGTHVCTSTSRTQNRPASRVVGLPLKTTFSSIAAPFPESRDLPFCGRLASKIQVLMTRLPTSLRSQFKQSKCSLIQRPHCSNDAALMHSNGIYADSGFGAGTYRWSNFNTDTQYSTSSMVSIINILSVGGKFKN